MDGDPPSTILIYAVGASPVLLLLQTIIASFRRKRGHVSQKNSVEGDLDRVGDASLHVAHDLNPWVTVHARRQARALESLRVVSCLGIFVVSAIGRHLGHRHLQVWDWQILAVSTYTLALSILTAFRSGKDRQAVLTLSAHLTFVLLGQCVYYAYCVLWPLATTGEWIGNAVDTVCLASSFIGGLLIPMIMPQPYFPNREHISFDAVVTASATELEVNPEETASFLSFISYSYLNPIIRQANRVPHLTIEMLPPLMLDEHAKVLRDRSFRWLDPVLRRGTKRRHVLFGVFRLFAWDMSWQVVWAVLLPFSELVGPTSLNQLLRYLEGQPTSLPLRPWVWLVLLFVGPFLAEVFMQSYSFLGNRAMVRLESTLIQLIFEHALRMRVGGNPDAERDGGAPAYSKGKLINLITTDMAQDLKGREVVMLTVYCTIQIISGFAFLYSVLGWSSVVGLAVMMALLSVPTWSARLLKTLQKKKMILTDKRVQLVSETLTVLRMIKLFAWNGELEKQIEDARKAELRTVWKLKLLIAVTEVVNMIIPFAHMVATYAVYTMVMHYELTASIVFSSAMVFSLIQQTFVLGMRLLPSIVQAKVSFDRLNGFLWQTEILQDPGSKHDSSGVVGYPNKTDHLGFGHASFTWNESCVDSEFMLIIPDEIIFRAGKINLILGPTGAGKTSVLMALLGEMRLTPRGPQAWVNLPRSQGIAYVAQQSWILNETIRSNIVFGSPFDDERYNKVLHQCALNPDLALFEAGDYTEVGERGITLSGGQKARITLARAIYSSAQTLLLDDIFAALDAHTARFIVEQCFQGDLVRGRTVILVTHNVALTSHLADLVVTVNLQGEVHAHSTVREALKEASHVETEENDNAEEEKYTRVQDTSSAERGKLILKEEMKLGRMGWPSFDMFLSAMGGRFSFGFVAGLLATLFASELAITGETWWLGQWSKAYATSGSPDATFYLSIYVAFIIAGTVLYGVATAVLARGTIRASRSLHQQLLASIMRSTLRWLDHTPMSRILTRCTQDVDAVDNNIPQTLFALLTKTATILIRFSAVVIFTPAFLLPGILVTVLGVWIGKVYLRAQLSMKREMSNAKSPVVALFGETVADLVSVRAYGAEELFKRQLRLRIENYTRAARSFWNLNRWIRFRMYLLSNTFTTALAAYMLYASRNRNPVDVGFSVTMAMAFSSILLWWIRDFNELEVQANSLERLYQYLHIAQEPASSQDGIPPAYWPASGTISVSNLSARYSIDGPKVLDGLSFELKAGERVGIVGRTGSGKSSLTLAMLRAIVTEGAVRFDGIDTKTINIDALRSAITYIPQSPELLTGTLRKNLDILGDHDDACLNSVLQAVHLDSTTRSVGEQLTPDRQRLTLDTVITTGGGNLSMGERQLVALARAMLKESKLLIMDEATSALDYETDALVQLVLREEFQKRGVTVLCVAHRLRAVMDADKIMVLHEGKMVELGTPAALLRDGDGIFRELVRRGHDAEELLRLAVVEDN